MPPLSLQADDANLTVADHAVRDLRIHGHQVLDAITVAVRDEAWGTFPADVRVTAADNTTAELHGRHGDVFAWTGRIEVTSATIRFEMRGRVLRDVDSRRIGVCLLHPQTLAGRPFRTDVDAGVFGVDIDPGPVTSGFRSLHFDAGCPVDIVLDGAPFEMEDHRNWSDPGWKSYCPPLATPGPLRRRAGEEIVQTVTVRGHPDAVPAIGTCRTDVHLVEGGPPAELSAAHPLSVALIGSTPGWLTDTAARVARHENLVRIAVFDPHSHTTAPGSAELVRDTLRGLHHPAPVGGGSRAHLAELNRLGAIGDWDFCTFPITAQAHHSDDASILATARAMPAMIATARRIAPGLPIVVGPLAFRRRVGANAPAGPADPADHRETGPLGATWLLGALLGLRGADALTVLLAPGGPAGALLRELHALRGRPFVGRPTGRADVLAATVLGEPAPVTLVANLGDRPAEVLGTTVAGQDFAIIDQGETVWPG